MMSSLPALLASRNPKALPRYASAETAFRLVWRETAKASVFVIGSVDF